MMLLKARKSLHGVIGNPAKWIQPAYWVRSISIKILPTQQPNRILRYKPPNLRVIIPKRVVMQPRLDIKILPLKSQVLFNLIHHQLFHRTPRPVLGLPDDLPFGVGHFQRCTNLVGVEVVNLVLDFAFFFIHAGQRRIAAGLVKVQAALAGAFLTQHPQALPEEGFVVGVAFDLGLFGILTA